MAQQKVRRAIVGAFSLAALLNGASAQTPTTCPADDCLPGSGPYPPECPIVEKVVVCQKDVLNPDPDNPTDDAYQFETAIAAVAQGCDLALAGLWIDHGQKVALPELQHLAMSISWEYDIFFAYSLDGGSTWMEKRLSGTETHPLPYFDPNLTTGEEARDYSGMTADPRPGTATFYLLGMGIPRDRPPGSNQDIFSYEVGLRTRGDFDADFDVDEFDGVFNYCFGSPYPDCSCAALDFDFDGDVDWWDFREFPLHLTGSLPECRGPCQPDPGYLAGVQGAGEPAGWTAEDVAQMAPGCELAAWYLSHAPKGYVYGFLAKLVDYLDKYPDGPAAEEILRFLECVLPLLP